MKALSRRTGTFTDSVIRRMTRVCLKCGAVNLSQGFPDFDPPKALTDEVCEHIVYESNLHTCLAFLPGMAERTFCFSALRRLPARRARRPSPQSGGAA